MLREEEETMAKVGKGIAKTPTSALAYHTRGVH
jgi:hypothetical protein